MAQQAIIDRNRIEPDSATVNTILEKANTFFFNQPDSCLYYATQAAELAHSLKLPNQEIEAWQMIGEAKRFLGDYPRSLEAQQKALDLAHNTGDELQKAYSLGFIGFTYIELSENRHALRYLFRANEIYDHKDNTERKAFNLSNIGGAYIGLGLLDSASFFLEQALTLAKQIDHKQLIVLTLRRQGTVSQAMGDLDEAMRIYQEALMRTIKSGDNRNSGAVQVAIAELHRKQGQMDSCLYYARNALRVSQRLSTKPHILQASTLILEALRDKNMPDSLVLYQDIVLAMKDSLFGAEKFRQLQLFALQEVQRQQEVIREQEQLKSRTRLIVLSGILVFVVVVAFFLYRNYRQKTKSNRVLAEQKSKLEQTLEELKAAQSQLIQSEKMASLGELTAGIAHEIQNPLNFVNNFSEVNKELLAEMEEAIQQGDFENAKGLAKDITENQLKINHHGKRADAIVKSMLQHSRVSSGKKEPTDINALCDEYLRLAYHGYRAKDKSFNAKFEAKPDPSLPKVNVVPQDIGRVILNLISNAFFAVSDKLRQAQPDSRYEPAITVSTKNWGDKIEISVKDNGNGIPEHIKEKIFQPFFTTKPAGQGTGLGLSLSYDIVKAHGGELKVETKNNEGSTFTITLSTK